MPERRIPSIKISRLQSPRLKQTIVPKEFVDVKALTHIFKDIPLEVLTSRKPVLEKRILPKAPKQPEPLSPAKMEAMNKALKIYANRDLIRSVDAHLRNPNAETPHSPMLRRLSPESLKVLRGHLDGTRSVD